jgi:hypothetical protein
VIRYAAIGTALVPSATNWFDDPVNTVNAVGSDEFGDGETLVGSKLGVAGDQRRVAGLS